MVTTLVFTNLFLLVRTVRGPGTKHPYKTIMTGGGGRRRDKPVRTENRNRKLGEKCPSLLHSGPPCRPYNWENMTFYAFLFLTENRISELLQKIIYLIFFNITVGQGYRGTKKRSPYARRERKTVESRRFVKYFCFYKPFICIFCSKSIFLYILHFNIRQF